MNKPDRSSAVAASTFRLDVKGAEVREALKRAGVSTILLKGAAFGRLLYGEAGTRNYMDVDLLVDPASLALAERVLRELDFQKVDDESSVRKTDASVGRSVGVQGALHATPWLRERDSFVIDLHDSLPQCGAPAEVVWRVLQEHTAVEMIGGAPTVTLDRPASALLIAVHAAHHGPGWGGAATSDLAEATEQFDFDRWRAARELAVELDAEAALGAGLGTCETGRAVAKRLSLRTEPSPARALQWSGAPWSASVLEALLTERGVRRRLAIVARLIWPSAHALRRGSALARRGTLGLAIAYLLRPFQLAAKLPSALRAVRASRMRVS